MASYRQQINMFKTSEVTVKDLSKINELENQLNLNKTKLNFFITPIEIISQSVLFHENCKNPMICLSRVNLINLKFLFNNV